MTITAYPFENQDVNESLFSRFFKELQDSGVAGSVGDTAFKVTSDGNGLDVQIAAGFAVLRGHAVYSDSAVTKTLSAANPTNPRIDRIVLRLDPTANTITVEVKEGTPASSPLAPTVTFTETGVFELSLAEVTVTAGAVNIGVGQVADNRTFLGNRAGNWTTATRPTSPRKARLGYNETNGAYEFWNGASWVPIGDKTGVALLSGATFTGAVVMQGRVEIGNGDGDVLTQHALPVRVDTRSAVYSYTSGNLAQVLESASGGVVRTTTFTYNAGGELTSIAEAVDGKTITTNYTYTGGLLTGSTRVVT